MADSRRVMLTCPDCGKRRARFWPSEGPRCARCEVRAELRSVGIAPRPRAEPPPVEPEPVADVVSLRDRIEGWLWH